MRVSERAVSASVPDHDEGADGVPGTHSELSNDSMPVRDSELIAQVATVPPALITPMRSPRPLTEGSISARLFQFALPAVYANVLQSLNSSVNSCWVGHYLGEAALTATSNANTVLFLLVGAAFGIAMAATILVGQFVGASELYEAKRVVGTGATFFFAVSVAVALAGLLLCRPLLTAMQTPAVSLPLAVPYMRVFFMALPCLYLQVFVMSILRGAGDSKTPFYFMLLAVVLDVGLNPVFIFGVGPIPKLGIAGSALATFVAQAVSLIALMRHLYRRHHMLCLRREELKLLRLNRSIARTLLKKGIPLGARVLVFTSSSVLVIALVNRFGVETTAAFGAALQVWSYLEMPAYAVSMAASSMAAQNVGALKWDRVHSIARVGVVYSLLLTGAIVLMIEISSPLAFGLFLPTGSAALPIAAHLDRIVVWSFLFEGVSMALFGVAAGAGEVVVSVVIIAVCVLLVRFPLAEVLLEHYHADAIWWSFLISSALLTLLAVVYYKHWRWRTARLLVPPKLP